MSFIKTLPMLSLKRLCHLLTTVWHYYPTSIFTQHILTIKVAHWSVIMQTSQNAVKDTYVTIKIALSFKPKKHIFCKMFRFFKSVLVLPLNNMPFDLTFCYLMQ